MVPHSLPPGLGAQLHEESLESITFGTFGETLRQGGSLYTDGTGGPKWANESIRRVAAGAVALTWTGSQAQGTRRISQIGVRLSQVPGKQTVPRSEMWAGIRSAAAATQGAGEQEDTEAAAALAREKPQRWGVDAAYVVDGLNKATAAANGLNQDLWKQLHRAAGNGDQALPPPTKVTSHLTTRQVDAGEISFEDLVGNGIADVCADVAANRMQEWGALLELADEAEQTAYLIGRRLALIEAHCWSLMPDRVPAPELRAIQQPPSKEEAKACAQQAL